MWKKKKRNERRKKILKKKNKSGKERIKMEERVEVEKNRIIGITKEL